MNKNITIVISTAFQDAGDATRAIEIAKALKKNQPVDIEAKIIFISHGSKFEQKVIDLGFDVYHAKPKLPGVGLYQDLGMTITNLIGTENLAEEMIKGEIETYKEIKPDIVLHGFWPMASLARRMMDKEIPGICFVPLPLVSNFFDVLPDVPEQLKIFSIFSKPVRLWLFRHIPNFIKNRVPILRQNNIRHAAYKLGWKVEKLVNTFDLLKADLTIVNDLPDYYDQSRFPSNVVFTGPLFSVPDSDEVIDPEIIKVFDQNNEKTKVFCALSSSGSEDMLTEVIKIFTYGKGLDWNAVILSPHFSIEKARKLLGNRLGVYITDKFIPALKINAMANITVSHGGQGTIQTAIHSGTPIVGVAAQQEQFINLSNIESRGAGIRIPRNKRTSNNIQKAVDTIIRDKRFEESTEKLKTRLHKMDGTKNSAELIWDFIKKHI
ncbi:MAG: nucleotide disphospho-sugar-binding domain-containing protein [Candidatus Absconditabacterales bacterium]|jgi:UDP:flavonoid glycosyltransferase YjiC (YdhE family)